MTEFTCASCGGVFTSGRSDEEARAEAKALYSESELAGPMEVICDDCFERFQSWARSSPLGPAKMQN